LTLWDFLGCFGLGGLKQFQLFLALGTDSDELPNILDFCLSSEMQLGFRDLIL